MPLQRPLMIVAAVALVMGGVFWLFWPAPLPPPDEALRVMHPAGYSMIRPPAFSAGINTTGGGEFRDGMFMSDPNHKHPKPTLSVERFRGEPDWERMASRGFKEKGTYQNREATLMIGPSGRPPMEVWNHRAIVKFGDEWFEIAVTDPTFFDMKKSSWRGYFESFRYEPRQPATTGGN